MNQEKRKTIFRKVRGRVVAIHKDSEEYYKHPDKPGEGAKNRKGLRGQKKVGVVMGEFKRGTLRSGSGEKVTSRKQAVAIAMSESGLSGKGRKGKV